MRTGRTLSKYCEICLKDRETAKLKKKATLMQKKHAAKEADTDKMQKEAIRQETLRQEAIKKEAIRQDTLRQTALEHLQKFQDLTDYDLRTCIYGMRVTMDETSKEIMVLKERIQDLEDNVRYIDRCI